MGHLDHMVLFSLQRDQNMLYFGFQIPVLHKMAFVMSIVRFMVSNEKKKSFFHVHGTTSRNYWKSLLIELNLEASPGIT